MDNSPLSDYVMIDVGGKLIGGLRKISPLPKVEGGRRGDSGDGPILYFTVDELQQKVARAKELGAEIIGQTVDLGKDRGRYQWIRDRAGNLIALWGAQ